MKETRTNFESNLSKFLLSQRTIFQAPPIDIATDKKPQVSESRKGVWSLSSKRYRTKKKTMGTITKIRMNALIMENEVLKIQLQKMDLIIDLCKNYLKQLF